jgi:hypothetical protein
MSTQRIIILKQVVAAWEEASQRLGIKITSPFILRIGKKSVGCIAFLPQFGGSNGMVIGATLPPNFDIDPTLIKCAQASGLFCSFINPEAYATFNEDRFKETLSDWQYFGPGNERPAWLYEAKQK